MSEFAKRLRTILERREMSQSELAEISKIRQSSISDYLNDRYKPKQDKVDAIAKALGVSPSYLMGVDPQDTPPYAAKTSYHYSSEGLTEDDIDAIEEFIEFRRQRKRK